MAADQSRTLPPDAGGVPMMTRRSLLKTGAGAATASAILAADGPLDVESPVGDAEAFVITGSTAVAIGAFGVGVSLASMYGTTIDGYEEALDAEIQKDLAIAHDSAVSEMHSYGMIETTYENDLETTDTMAHMEARNAIATAWETGKTAADAYDDALAAIRDYYAERVENNWIQATAKSSTQLSYILTAAIEAEVDDGSARDINDDAGGWAFGTVEHPTHGTCSWSELLDERSEVNIELQNNETITVPLPDVLLEWDGAGISKTVNLIRFLRGYNDSTGDFEVEIDGEMAAWSGNMTIPSLSFDGSTLQSYTVMDFDAQYRSILSAVDGQASTVIGNYDQGLVDSLYTKLDNGEITPSEVRGIDGQAEFLAGTSDASADAYRLSLLQQLDMEQADLSDIASMSGTFTGFSGLNVERGSSGTRSIYLGSSVTDKQLDGQLFAHSIPDTGLNSGGDYVVDPITFGSISSDVAAFNTTNGTKMWEYKQFDSIVFSISTSPDGNTVFAGDSDGNVHAFDAGDGTQKWTFAGPTEDVNEIIYCPVSDRVYVGFRGSGSIKGLDPSDGSEVWSFTASDTIINIEVSPDGSNLHYATMFPAVKSIKISDQTERWSFTNHSANSKGLGVSPDGSTVHFGTNNNTVYAINDSDGTEAWTWSASNSVYATETGPNGYVYAGFLDGTLTALDPDGNVKWSNTSLSDLPETFSFSPDGNRVYAGGQGNAVLAVDTSSGSEIWLNSTPTNSVQSIGTTYETYTRDYPIGGTIYGGKFFDAPSSETVDMQNGILTLESMSDQDGNDIETTSGEDWGDPDYDDLNLNGWIDYLIKTEKFRETIEQYIDETSPGGGSTGDSWGLPTLPSWIPGSGLVQWLIVGGAALVGVNVATN